MVEFGRGGACVPARVAPQGRIRRSSPAHNMCIFGMETPLRERSGGHIGTAPTVSSGQIARGTVDFVWVDYAWMVGVVCWIARGTFDVVWVDCVRVVLFVGKTVHMNQHHRCCTFVSPGLIERSEIYPG